MLIIQEGHLLYLVGWNLLLGFTHTRPKPHSDLVSHLAPPRQEPRLHQALLGPHAPAEELTHSLLSSLVLD